MATSILPFIAIAEGSDFVDSGSGLKFHVVTEDASSRTGTVQLVNDSYIAASYTIPKTVASGGVTYTVTSIGYGVFQGCSSLTSITIPDSVTDLGNFAFEGCSGLSAITIPDSVTAIGIGAFQNTGLTSVIIPTGVNYVYDYAFYGCGSLTSVTFLRADQLTIGGHVFTNTIITTVTVPAGMAAEYGSKLSGKLPAGATITAAAATITEVTVTPSTAAVERGGTLIFSAEVSGSGSFTKAVTWSLTGTASGSVIDQTTGVLTVGKAEYASTLTVKAASLADESVSSTAAVTIKPAGPQEKFSLPAGSTCYFDMSGITATSWTVNTALPDTSLKWVPFTYVGTVNAYSLAASDSSPGAASDRSLFLADRDIIKKVSWSDLDNEQLIFGKNYAANGMCYLLRSLSAGNNNSGGNQVPESNEWDQIAMKGSYISNYENFYSWGQDTASYDTLRRVLRGYSSLYGYLFTYSTYNQQSSGMWQYNFRPALEILNADALSSNALKTVVYDMDTNGTLGNGSLTSATVVYTGELTLPEVTEANGFKYTGTMQSGKTLGWYYGSTFYEPGIKLSALPSGAELKSGYGTYIPAVINAALSPANVSYDRNPVNQADVQTTIIWGSATGVTDVRAGGNAIGSVNYSVSGNTLAIKKEYLAAQATGSLQLTVEFNTGAATVLTISIADTTPPSISPTSCNYDLSAPADVTTAITWNSAASVTDVVYNVTPAAALYTLSAGDYTVSDDKLTIKKSFLSGLSLTTGVALEFDITFNTGAAAALTVNVVNNYTPSDNADLSSLSVNGTPVSDFDPGVTSYNVVLPYGTTNAIVAAAVSDSNAKVSITQASSLPGSATVEVTAENGTTIKTYSINLTTAPPAFVPVTGITGVPATATCGTPLTLTGIVTPANATNQTVVWSVQKAGTTSAKVSGNTLFTTAAGVVTVRATVKNGLTQSSNYTQDFNITVSAAPITTCTVTFNSRGSVYTTKTVNAGDSIGRAAWPADPARSNYTFGGWFTGENGAGTQFTSATPVNAAITVYAKWTYNGGFGGGGGGSPVEIPTSSTSKTETTVSGNTVTATTTVTATVDGSGKATASVTQTQVSDIVRNAINEAAKHGNDMVAVVEIKVDAVANANTVEVILPKAAVDTVAGSNIDALTVSTHIAAITFDSKALDVIAEAATTDVKISMAKVDTAVLDQATKQAVGDRPVYNFSVTSGSKIISQFGGNVSVSAPYTPKAGEDTNAIVIYCIDAEGRLETVSNCHYDPATGKVTFTTTHFSKYVVGYNKVSFKDVAEDAWYSDAVEFIAARGITTGTGSRIYSPEAKLTRGEFLVMMMRSYGISPDTNPADNFTDAGSAYYTGYLAVAKRLGISDGVGNKMFAPGKEITRQEMFTLLYNTLKKIGGLPNRDSGKTLSSFGDEGQVASWAKDAMTLFIRSGIVDGSGGKLSPAETTTRAQMAQVLYNLMSK